MRNWARQGEQRQNEVRFESGMTSEQKFNSVAEAVLSQLPLVETVRGCAMHPKLSRKCRKCQQLEKGGEREGRKEEGWALETAFPEQLRWNTNFFKTHFSEKLQKNIEESQFYKSKVKPISSVKELSNSVTPDQISIDAYLPGSSDTPTHFMGYFYRLAELHPTREQVLIMLKANNVNVRCLVLLYLRVFADPAIVYACINHSFRDNKLLSVVTIGEYAMRLFDEAQLNHGGFRIPRLPAKVQKEIDRRVGELKEAREKEFQRERSRSRERKSRREEQQREESASQSQSPLSPPPSPQPQTDPMQGLSLKEKIRLLQQQKRGEQRRRQLLQSYKAEQVLNLESDEQQYNQNDEVQKYKMG